jgi:DNA ligase (NAD+)
MNHYSITDFFNKLKSLDQTKLDSIKGIGPILADNIVEFTTSQRFQNLNQAFNNLQNKGLAPQVTVPIVNTSSKYSGKTFVITGSFEISRDLIKEKLEQLGATVSGSISKSTNYLLAGEKAGSKLDKAQSLGVVIVNSLEELGI